MDSAVHNIFARMKSNDRIEYRKREIIFNNDRILVKSLFHFIANRCAVQCIKTVRHFRGALSFLACTNAHSDYKRFGREPPSKKHGNADTKKKNLETVHGEMRRRNTSNVES